MNGIFCDPRDPKNKPDFWVHALGICNLIILHVNPLPVRMPQWIKTD